ncbi:MAG: electron transport complex subunit RsxC [Desulfobacteraceae bacterium]
MKFKGLNGKASFAHGVHPPDVKDLSKKAAIEVLPAPAQVKLPLQQNIGGPCHPIVKPRQEVAFGQMVGDGQTFVSASIHASVAGKVQRPAMVTLPNGRHMKSIVIKSNSDQPHGRDLWQDLVSDEWPKGPFSNLDPDEINILIYEAGIVGLGGAAFPTHVKIIPNDKKPVDTLLINGCECEPCLTADYRMMVEAPHPIIAGALLAARAVNARNIIIGVEDNKMDAVAALKEAAKDTPVKVAVLKTKYPQGSEKQLIYAITRRRVPLGGLPSDVSVAMSNVGTIAAVAMAVLEDIPLTHRVVTVTGNGVVQPKNLWVPLGTSFGELVKFCGGLKPDAVRMIAGGPMMGFAFTDMDAPVTKGTSGLTVLTEKDITSTEETQCVRCGRCVDVCPMHLVPTRLALASRYGDVDLARRYNISACFECGCCAYICPANLPLVQLIRSGKALLTARAKA